MIAFLEKGVKLATMAQDIYLQGLSYSYLAEAYYSIEDLKNSIYHGCLGSYLLKQINSLEWRKSAGLITIIKGQLGDVAFERLLAEMRSHSASLRLIANYCCDWSRWLRLSSTTFNGIFRVNSFMYSYQKLTVTFSGVKPTL